MQQMSRLEQQIEELSLLSESLKKQLKASESAIGALQVQ